MAVRLSRTAPGGRVTYRYALVQTSWGYVGFACRDELLCRLVLVGMGAEGIVSALKSEYPQGQRDDKLLGSFQGALREYFAGGLADFDCVVDISWASDFAAAVLGKCVGIGLGRTSSYGELAALAGHTGAGRAVGSVLGANRTPLVIPCHRVVGSDGKLCGFSAGGGVDLKERLLSHERSQSSL